MNREVVDLGQHLADIVERFDAEFFRPLFREKRIVAEHAHLEGLRAFGNRQPDAAQADDAERFIGQLGSHELAAIPAMLDEALIGGGDIPRQGQHHREGMLRRAERVAGGRVHDDDAQSRSGFFIDVVGADAGPDDRFEAMVACQGVGGDLHAATTNGAVEFGERCGAARRPSGPCVLRIGSRLLSPYPRGPSRRG